ncbi:MAG: hypothetical protein L6V87_10970 [Ruminococcus sp.]|nr:MAG: hypothetical protein L6V87_10970 [Ruminococcus sp.]
MIIRNDMELAAAKQLSLDFSCTPQDFFKNENTVTVPAIRRGQACIFPMSRLFFVRLPWAWALLYAQAPILPNTRVLAKNTAGTEIFTASVMSALNRELFSHGCCIGLLNQYYVPAVPYRPAVRSEGFTLRVFDENNIAELFLNTRALTMPCCTAPRGSGVISLPSVPLTAGASWAWRGHHRTAPPWRR